jgi:aryl-alcohol dehydrogenase-like predicted oxidoreductase
MKLTRRDLIRFGTGASVVALGGPWGSLLAGSEDLIEVTIPSSGRKVPAVGIGTVRFRGATGGPEMAPLRETLEVFHRLGGRVIDTSPNYGNSEEVLGFLLGALGVRDDVFMATKVDREDRAAGIERIKGSIERLGPPIDLMQVHNLRGTDEQMPTLLEWRDAGRLGHIGITTHRVEQHDGIEKYMTKYPLDFIQVNYSLDDRAAAERLLPLAQDRGIAVLVNRPFGRGRLFDAVRGKALPDWAADIDARSWGQIFLKYVIAHPAATLPIPGTSKPHHAEDNMAALRGRLPDAALRREMEVYFDALL